MKMVRVIILKLLIFWCINSFALHDCLAPKSFNKRPKYQESEFYNAILDKTRQNQELTYDELDEIYGDLFKITDSTNSTSLHLRHIRYQNGEKIIQDLSKYFNVKESEIFICSAKGYQADRSNNIEIKKTKNKKVLEGFNEKIKIFYTPLEYLRLVLKLSKKDIQKDLLKEWEYLFGIKGIYIDVSKLSMKQKDLLLKHYNNGKCFVLDYDENNNEHIFTYNEFKASMKLKSKRKRDVLCLYKKIKRRFNVLNIEKIEASA